MEWLEIAIHTTNEANEPIANILNEFGANGVVIEENPYLSVNKENIFGEIYELDVKQYPEEGVIVKAYFLNDDKWPEKERAIKQKINALQNFSINLGNNTFTVSIVKEEDWENEWKKYFKPFNVTDRFVIVPTWETYTKKETNDLIIHLDPGMAFGTGTHATTMLSIRALESVVKPNDIVVDVGSGSGILSIASALLGASKVFSYDLDPVAVSSTEKNRDLNKLTDKITVQQNHLLKDIDLKADVIVANILAHIILELIDDAWKNLKPGGNFITAGIILKYEQQVAERLMQQGFSIVERLEKDDWVTFIAQKRS